MNKSLIYLQLSPVLIPVIVGILNFKYIQKWKWLFYYVCYGAFNELISVILVKIGFKNTLFLNHIYTFNSFILLSLFYMSVFQGYIHRKWFWLIMLSYIFFFTVSIIFFQHISVYPSLTYSVFSLLIIIFSIIFFYKTMIESKIVQILKEPIIWMNSAIILSFTGNLFFFILFNFLLDYSYDFVRMVINYVHLLNGLSYILIAIGFWKAGKQESVSKNNIIEKLNAN